MQLSVRRNRLVVAAFTLALVALGGWAISAPPEAPKVSTYAPAEDLAAQWKESLKGLKASVADADQYKDDQEKIAKEANALVLVALALGLHDEPNAYQKSAAAMIKGAQGLAAANTFPAAGAAVAALENAGAAGADAAKLKWEKLASLPQLMKHVPNVNTKLKIKLNRFAKNSKDVAGLAAVLAVIAEGAMFDESPAKGDAQKVAQWYQFCQQMRDAAAAVNAGCHKKDAAATQKANDRLQQSCEDCHAVFKPAALANPAAAAKN